MSKRVVTKVKFHDVQLVLPAPVGAVPNELPSRSKTINCSMAEGLVGVELTFAGYEPVVVVPYANVQIYTALETPTELTKKTK